MTSPSVSHDTAATPPLSSNLGIDDASPDSGW